MFNAKLYKFQEKHVENLLSKCADHEELVLCSPTGSGKTVMVSKFIDDYILNINNDRHAKELEVLTDDEIEELKNL